MNDLEPNWVTLWPLTSALDDAIDPFKSINETRCQSMTIMLSWPLWSWLSWRKKVFFITLVKIMSIYVYFLAVGLTYLLNYASVILALVSFIRIHDYMYFQRQLTLTSSIFQFKELFDWKAFTFSFFHWIITLKYWMRMKLTCEIFLVNCITIDLHPYACYLLFCQPNGKLL